MSLSGTVIDLSSDGWGVVKVEGRVIFVPGTWPGDEIDFEIEREGKFTLGKVLAWRKKSAAHRSSPCPHWGLDAGRCGACPWMGIDYAEQVRAKEKRLQSILAKFRIRAEVHPLTKSGEFAYRNRVKLSSTAKALGFKSPLSNDVTDIESCLVAEDWVNDEIKKLRLHPRDKSEYWIPNTSFAQGNTRQNERMRQRVADLVLAGAGSGLELFCGDGNFTEVLAAKIKHLKAYESSSSAIAALKQKMPEVQASVLDLYSGPSLSKLISQNANAEFLFLDPPRSGYKDFSKLVQGLKKLKSLIYLSCDPMTFARDTSELLSKDSS